MASIKQGDCLELMKEIPDKSVDMILCDLPYGTTRNKWDSIIPLNEIWKMLDKLVKPNGAIVLFAQTPFDKMLGASNLKMLRYEWIWDKKLGTGHLNAKKMPMKQHENILVFYKKLPTYNPQMREGQPYHKTSSTTSSNYGKQTVTEWTSDGGRYPISILELKNSQNTDIFLNSLLTSWKAVQELKSENKKKIRLILLYGKKMKNSDITLLGELVVPVGTLSVPL